PMLNLMDMPGYRKAFKAIKSLITDVSETHKISAELLASRRQINQLLGWRGELMAEALHNLLQEYPQ
ncbi:ribonuclease D, partial [Escherichia marmotae]|nr:ribonuclease D [Escherichia marmotae]